MKKCIILVSMISLSFTNYAQQTTIANQVQTHFSMAHPVTAFAKYHDSVQIVKNREYYESLSKQYRRNGRTLLIVGAGLIAGGLLIGNRNSSTFDEAGIGAIVGTTGFFALLGNIPYFIASRFTTQKAMLTRNSF